MKSRYALIVSSLFVLSCTSRSNNSAQVKAKTSKDHRKELIVEGHVQKENWTPRHTEKFDFTSNPLTKVEDLATAETNKHGVIKEMSCDFYQFEEEVAKVYQEAAEELNVDQIGPTEIFALLKNREIEIAGKRVSPKKNKDKLMAILADHGPGGRTPKFFCKLPKSGQVVKIKYNPKSLNPSWKFNGEVFGEGVSTKLIRSLGFYSDKIFPVAKLICNNCPVEPWTATRQYFGLIDALDRQVGFVQPNTVAETTILSMPSSVEKKTLKNVVIELRLTDEGPENSKGELAKKHSKIKAIGLRTGRVAEEGWGFDELIPKKGWLGSGKTVSPEEKVKREALVIMAAFINHMDNKAEQQRIICPKKDIEKKEVRVLDFFGVPKVRKVSTCTNPSSAKFMIQDAGSILGSGLALKQHPLTPNSQIQITRPALDKMNRDSWEGLSIWSPVRDCVVRVNMLKLPNSVGLAVDTIIETPSLSSYQVSKESVAFMQSFFKGISQDDAEKLFKWSLIDEMGENSTGSSKQWAESFMKKVNRDIMNPKCK